jgi:hypothetical protein
MSFIPEDEYLEAVDSNLGWCTECEEFTNDFAEPDAENCKCDFCGQMTVMGAEQALILCEISFSEEEVDEDSPIPYKVVPK